MQQRILIFLIAASCFAKADILTSTQTFFGLASQNPDYIDEEPVRVTDFSEAPFSPADSDLGIQEILVAPPETSPLIVDIRSSVLKTDNAPSGIARRGESSWISLSRASLAWRPHLGKGWFGDFQIAEDFARFDEADARDYENFSTRIGVYRNFVDLSDSTLFSAYEYQRLTTGSLSDSDYNAQRIRAGIQKSFWQIPGQQLSGSLNGAYEWTASPETLRRNLIGANLNHRYSITDTIFLSTTFGATYFNYTEGDREDWSYRLSNQLVWQVSKTIKAIASLSFSKNDSTTAGGVNDFESWTGGLGFAFQATF